MVNEFEQIARLQKKLGKLSTSVIVGIGDDAAVLRPSRGPVVATVDSLVEGVHFDREYVSAEEVGHRALAVNLSDIAAMGAVPRQALVSIALPPSEAPSFLDGFYKGLSRLAKKAGVDVVGGNLSKSPRGIFVDVTLLGEATASPILRSGARPGDAVAVVGRLGEAALGLGMLRRLGRARALSQWPRFTRAQLLAQPQLKAGLALSKGKLATSLIDVSDGLSSELMHLAVSSGVQMEIDPSRVPLAPGFAKAARELGGIPWEFQLHGGEDYALLFTFRPAHWARVKAKLGAAVTVIGRVVKGKPAVWLAAGTQRMALRPRGFDHFQSP